MSQILIKWLNNDIHLSKPIKNIPEDFRNGYFFAELLHKTKQIQNLSQFKNSNNKKDILRNYCLLNNPLIDMGIILNEKDRNEIINGSIYTSKIYLLKIRQVLDKKCINLEQLKYKYSNDLHSLYNKMMYKNQNEKYLYNLKIRLENEKNSIYSGKSDVKAITEGKINDEKIIDQKYALDGPLYKQLKHKFSHLDLTDFELEIILLDMKDQEIKMNYLKEKVQKTEKIREKQCISKEKKELKNWNASIIKIKKFKDNLLKESWEPVLKYQKGVMNYFKKNGLMNEKITKSFENNLNFFLPKKNENEEGEDEISLKKSMDLKNEIYIRQIKERLEEKLKSKKDKEKRERKRLKEEREMFERINTERNMSDMIKNMEKNINKVNVISVKGDELDAKTEQLMKSMSPIEQKRIKYVDELVNKEINKGNKIDELNNENEKNKISKVNMNIIKLINKKNSSQKENLDEKEIKENPEEENINNENNNNIEQNNINQETTIYSKLTENDYGLYLINDTFKIHNKDININDRIKLFKTRLMYNDSTDEKFKNLPKLPEMSITEEDEASKRVKSESNIMEKSTNYKNNKNIFDKESFYEEMNKLNYENFKKASNERKIKKEKKNKLIKPLIEKIIDITDYIFTYQENKSVKLLYNAKWDEIMDRFINWEDIYDNEEDEVITQNEESEYLFDYGDYLTDNDNLILFDYINYLNIFNDLIIPTNLRGKQFKYYELYDEVYSKLNNDVDIKEYEPNEDEIDNLILPKSPNFANFKFYDIIENVIKNKYNKNIKKSAINNDVFGQKGKYFYLPIKMSIVGYPLSGKKIQSSLISEKYPNIKVFDPKEILENKLEEYKELKTPVEKTTKSKNMKQNQLDQLIKEREEKLENFKPILNIIQPYLDYVEKYSNKTINLDESNNQEDIINDIYINLLIYELDKVFPDDKDSKNKLIEEINEKYKQYISIQEQIKEIKNNEQESKKESEEKGNKNKKNVQNLAKDLELLNKQLETIIPSLYVGFIFINFPKNVIQAKKLENKITGYISEFEKPKDIVEEKLFSYNNIFDINIKQNKNNISQISMFDLFINLNISSDEVDKRFNNTKYDPNTKKTYNMEVNPPTDKKILEKLLPGIPNYNINKINEEKDIYEKTIYNLVNFYKIMTNGNSKIYKNIDQMNKTYITNINTNIENSIHEVIFDYYLKNIELIIVNLNKTHTETPSEKIDIKVEENEQKEEKVGDSEKAENTEKVENLENAEKIENEEKIIPTENTEKVENEEKIEKVENIKSSKKEENRNNNSSIKEINAGIYNFVEEIYNQFEAYANGYQNKLINFLHFISRQKEHMIFYLTKIQNEFILYLNRKTEKTNIAEIYINKYNSIINNHSNLLNNPKVYNELMEDIEDVGKSIWLNIQNKKNEDVQYLKNVKETGKLDNELQKFWEFSLIVIEAEVKKYLITCEIIIKYYLNQTGLLGNILGIFENNLKINQLNEFLFKINHLKYLFNGIDIPENLNINTNINDEINNNIKGVGEGYNEINIEKKENKVIVEEENEDNNEKADKAELTKSKLSEKNKDKDNLKNEFNETEKSNKKEKKEKTLEEKLEILFMNSLKIIIRQDLLMKQYKEKIKNCNPINEKDNKKNSINKLLNSSVSSKSSHRKSKINKLSKNGFLLYEEELNYQIKIEKLKFKYRLMFLKNFILKYYNIIIECFNNTYNAMDDWIIMSVRSQNNILNEFTFYLKKLLTKSDKNASLEDFEFDTFDIYKRYKIDISFIFEKMNLNSIVNLKKKQDKEKEKDKEKIKEKNNEKNEIILINENDMPYIDKYIYNINDLMYIYNYIKTFGTEGCEYLVKYEIVQEILIHHYFSKKKYGDLSNINNSKSNVDSDANSVEVNNSENNSINFLKSSKSINLINEENNGVPKIVLFLSNVNYINFLNKFSEYDYKYININNLFTSLLIIGSELITSEKFMEYIQEQIKNNNSKHILLSKEEFLNLNLWFENDKYLTTNIDEKEEALFNKENSKIQKIKTCIFDINEEEGKIDLNKISNLLDKYNGKIITKIKKEKIEGLEIEEENKCDEEKKENENDIKEEKKENENEIKKEEENVDKIKEEEKKEEKEVKKEEGKVVEDEKENKEEKNEEEEEEENMDDKESVKNDATSSIQNDSEEVIKDMIKSKRNKKNKKDEIVNNIFNALFIN